jgi:hypothetical protein
VFGDGVGLGLGEVLGEVDGDTALPACHDNASLLELCMRRRQDDDAATASTIANL